MKKLVVGILAHVDAGKTTLSESMLYVSGGIRKLGRVDKGDAFLDTYELEKLRGITIFSKQAIMKLKNSYITLLDTPGHIDFSAEMERTLAVLDYAILVISAMDGVQGHTQTVWSLLNKYKVPVYIFINKMDQNGTDRQEILTEIKTKLNDNCIDFSTELSYEEIAMCDEDTLDNYINIGKVEDKSIARLIFDRKLFPCYFGSALKLDGVEQFMCSMDKYCIDIYNHTEYGTYNRKFGARIYKISRDEQGNRLTHMKITSGSLGVKDIIKGADNEWEEKVNQIRIYSGVKYATTEKISAGDICAVTGLTKSYAGEGLGIEVNTHNAVLVPVLTYKIIIPDDCNKNIMFTNLKKLEEEEPMLHIEWNEKLSEIHVQLMGEVQIEVLKSIIRDRFGVNVEFGTGNIVYKETINNVVVGVGHYEPLKHYAEVHLLMEPAKRGTGLQFDTDCSEDILDKNWQRLIITHLQEKEHKGVLTGSAITDMKITLINGRAHQKHTEGGDFRQAVYRAVRQGLMQARSQLLEPFFDFTLEVPSEMIGRAMSDIDMMNGTILHPENNGTIAIIKGSAPISTMKEYQKEVISYTRGKGKLSCIFGGYNNCHNSEEVISVMNYDPLSDIDNQSCSVFCTHGAGFVVNWNEVEKYMHLSNCNIDNNKDSTEFNYNSNNFESILHNTKSLQYHTDRAITKELEDIFERTYGKKIKKNLTSDVMINKTKSISKKDTYVEKMFPKKHEYLLVDGYNIIYAWDNLKELMEVDVGAARSKLMDIMCNYQGYKKCTLILVFDAYNVKDNIGEAIDYNNIHVIFTKEAETADQYIEKFAHEMGKKYDVTVATSDGLEQLIIRGQGCKLMSARDFFIEVENVNMQIRTEYLEKQKYEKNYLFNHMSEDMAEFMEEVRLGKKTMDDN